MCCGIAVLAGQAMSEKRVNKKTSLEDLMYSTFLDCSAVFVFKRLQSVLISVSLAVGEVSGFL